MTVAEISRRENISYIYNIYPFIYKTFPRPDTLEKADFWVNTFGVSYTQSTEKVFITELFRLLNTLYEQEPTENDIYSNDASFYFDNAGQYISFHAEHDTSPLANDYGMSIASGFTDSRVIYIDNIEYFPLITGSPQINDSQDLQNYTIPSYVSGELSLKNEDGRIDYLIQESIYGNTVFIYYLDDTGRDYTRTDLINAASLYVEDYDFTVNDVVLKLQDRRKIQNITIPTDRFTATDYPDIEDNLKGTVIPMLWGFAFNVPAVCTNGATTSGNVEYRVCSTALNLLGSIQVDTSGNGDWLTVTEISKTAATGEWVLSASDARDTNGKPLKSRITSVNGINITNTSRIIVDINDRFLGVAFNDTNYDTTEWATEEADLSTGGYFLTDEKYISDIFVEIQNGSNLGFRYEILPDGRRTIRLDNEDRTVSGTIRNRNILNRSDIPISTDSEQLIAITSVGYGYDESNGTNLRVVYDEMADTVELTYRQRPRYPETGDLRTFLLTEANALEKAEYLSSRFSSIRGIASLPVRGYLNMRIYDIFYIELTPADFIDGTTITGRQYFGVRKCKIIEVQPNYKAGTNDIKAVIID